MVKSCLLKPLPRLWTVSKSSLVMEEVMALITSSKALHTSSTLNMSYATIWYVLRPETRNCWAIWLILTSPNSCWKFAVVIISPLSRAQQPRGRSWNTVQWLSTHARQSSQAWPPTQVTHGQVTIHGDFSQTCQSSWPERRSFWNQFWNYGTSHAKQSTQSNCASHATSMVPIKSVRAQCSEMK